MDPDQQIADLEREVHRLRVALAEAQARARTWRRVAQFVYEAQQGGGGDGHDSVS